ncbi:MAG: cob(I)yrinic acid a,c-diamide adenosyltransferase [Candidatus Omnitrophota bacterium]
MIQVYTGDGKGKTTAALGLALRASGAGLKIYFGQFLKKGCYSEIKALLGFKSITLEQFGRGCFVKGPLSPKDFQLAAKGLKKAKKAVSCGKYDMIILDEINVAVSLGLIKACEVVSLIRSTPKKTELILTGRNAHHAVIKSADLVSHIKDVKHYYRYNRKARRGLEF